MESPLLSQHVDQVPLAVVDLETTGLNPAGDRIVEVSVVRLGPDAKVEVVLDTLLDPQRPMAATEIHGITDSDVTGAPTFSDVAGELGRALADSVLAAYNVYFDVRFLNAEFERVGLKPLPPHVCLMYLRPLLGLGKKCGLVDACRIHGIEHAHAHRTAADALAAASLWPLYVEEMERKDLKTLWDLQAVKRYKFFESFGNPIWEREKLGDYPVTRATKPRLTEPTHLQSRVHEYWEAVKAAVADLEITEQERGDLAVKRGALDLSVEELRAVHGRVYAAMLDDVLADARVTDSEWTKLRRLYQCLRDLGWAPGM